MSMKNLPALPLYFFPLKSGQRYNDRHPFLLIKMVCSHGIAGKKKQNRKWRDSKRKLCQEEKTKAKRFTER